MKRLTRDYFLLSCVMYLGTWPRNTAEFRNWLRSICADTSDDAMGCFGQEESKLLLTMQRIVDYINQDQPLFYDDKYHWGHYTFISNCRQESIRRNKAPRRRREKISE